MITFIRATLRGASRRSAAAAASAAANGGGGRAGPGLGFRARPPNGRAACAIGSLGDRRWENWWKWVLCFLFGASLWYEEREGKKEGEAEKGLLLRAHLAASVSGNTQSTRRGLPTSEPTGGWVPPRVGPGCHCVVAPARRRWACGCVGGEGPHVPSSSGGPHIRRGLAGPVLAGGRSASGRLWWTIRRLEINLGWRRIRRLQKPEGITSVAHGFDRWAPREEVRFVLIARWGFFMR